MIAQRGRIDVLIQFDSLVNCYGGSLRQFFVLFLGQIYEILVVVLSLLVLMAWNVTMLQLWGFYIIWVQKS